MAEEKSSAGASCTKCFLLSVVIALGVLCLAGFVVFCVLYYIFAVQDGVNQLQNKITMLESQLNESQNTMATLQAQTSDAVQFEALTQDFSDQLDQLMTDANEQIAAIQEELMTTLLGSDSMESIGDEIDLINAQKNNFTTRVASSVSTMRNQLEDIIIAIYNNFTIDVADFNITQTLTEFQETTDSVNERVSVAGEHKTYVRYGSSTCPNTNGTTLVYSGYNAGTAWNVQGGAANFICLPQDPEYTLLTGDAHVRTVVHGSEYESVFFGSSNENIPCAVCSVPSRPEVIMIPAKVNCPASWTSEYVGYLHSENRGNWRSSFICVDVAMEFIPGKTGNQVGSDLWIVEASCASLPCPPYNEEAEMSCVVCSK